MSRFPNDMERHAQDGVRAMQLENITIQREFESHMTEAFPLWRQWTDTGKVSDLRHAFARGWHASKRNTVGGNRA